MFFWGWGLGVVGVWGLGVVGSGVWVCLGFRKKGTRLYFQGPDYP